MSHVAVHRHMKEVSRLDKPLALSNRENLFLPNIFLPFNLFLIISDIYNYVLYVVVKSVNPDKMHTGVNSVVFRGEGSIPSLARKK